MSDIKKQTQTVTDKGAQKPAQPPQPREKEYELTEEELDTIAGGQIEPAGSKG
jgi:hypothetical protein